MVDNLEEIIQRAMAEARAGDRRRARQLLSEALKSYPQEARLWYLLSQMTETKEQAYECLERALKLEPGNPQIKAKLDKLKEPAQMPELNPEPPPRRMVLEEKPKTAWLMIATLAVFAFVCLALFLIKPAKAPNQVETATVTYGELMRQRELLTEAQFDAYEEKLKGKRVTWAGQVADVAEDLLGRNNVWVDMRPPFDNGHDLFFEYPLEESLALVPGQPITFRGTYGSITFGVVSLDNAQILP